MLKYPVLNQERNIPEWRDGFLTQVRILLNIPPFQNRRWVDKLTRKQHIHRISTYFFLKVMLVLIFLNLMNIFRPAFSQSAEDYLKKYIDIALEQNQGIKSKKFDLEKSIAALKEAESMFFPTVSFRSGYTKAEGGRTIDLPLGDLINPIYRALNELTSAERFPILKNESFLLNPDNFYDAKFHTELALINVEMIYNKRIKQQVVAVHEEAVNIYKRALIKDVKTAYYMYCEALQGESVYKANKDLIEENIRENQLLILHGKSNGTALSRSQLEQERNNTSLIESKIRIGNARSYFNFLLNRPLGDSILIDWNSVFSLPAVSLDNTVGISAREELKEQSSIQQAHQLDYKLQQTASLPKLNTFLDLGSQGYDFRINNKTRYYLWGINLQWDIFTGGRRKAKIAQSQANLLNSLSRIEQIEQSLMLGLNEALNNYEKALAILNSTKVQLSFSEKYYKDQLKTYHVGQLLYMELLDAQNQLVNSRLRLIQAIARVQIAAAALERERASYPIHDHLN